jgi:hypothetical protein
MFANFLPSWVSCLDEGLDVAVTNKERAGKLLIDY